MSLSGHLWTTNPISHSRYTLFTIVFASAVIICTIDAAGFFNIYRRKAFWGGVVWHGEERWREWALIPWTLFEDEYDVQVNPTDHTEDGTSCAVGVTPSTYFEIILSSWYVEVDMFVESSGTGPPFCTMENLSRLLLSFSRPSISFSFLYHALSHMSCRASEERVPLHSRTPMCWWFVVHKPHLKGTALSEKHWFTSPNSLWSSPVQVTCLSAPEAH